MANRELSNLGRGLQQHDRKSRRPRHQKTVQKPCFAEKSNLCALTTAIAGYDSGKSTIIEFEKAIEKQMPKQVDELTSWLEEFRKKQVASMSVESWLQGDRS